MGICAHAGELGERILAMHPPLQSTTEEVPAELSALLRKPLPAQAFAIGGLVKHLRQARAARIVAECGAGNAIPFSLQVDLVETAGVERAMSAENTHLIDSENV